MIYTLKQKKDYDLEKESNKYIKELNQFFNLNPKKDSTKIILVSDRRTIDSLSNKKTEDWVVGWIEGDIVFVLDKENYEKESSHKYSKEEYNRLIKHELSHVFTEKFLKNKKINKIPIWLSEGIAIYLSGQNIFKKKPEKFSKFLSFYEKIGKEVYNESGFFIELLIKKYGKNKFLNFLKSLEKIDYSKEKFNQMFKKSYNINLNYKEINSLYSKF